MFSFLTGEDENYAYVMNNYSWAIATKAIPIEEFRKDWKRVTLPEEKIQKMLQSYCKFAVVAGMTPEAGQFLTRYYPMPKEQERVALDKGYATLSRYQCQAEAEEAAEKLATDKKIKPLAGAALDSLYKKTIEGLAPSAKPGKRNQAAAPAEPALVNPADEVGTANNATENDGVLATKRRNSAKGKKLTELAREVTEDLNEAEAAGENPDKLMKARKPVEPKPKKEPKVKEAKGFDPAKLKGADGKYKSVSAMLKGLILEGKLKTDEAIFKATQKQFPDLADDKLGYVKWNRNWLKKEGAL